MRESLMPAGGVMPALFSDDSLSQVQMYTGHRDPAIWTGAYLAAQALRLLETGAADAAARVAETVRVLHRWWRISGDPGYLARFAARADSPAPILATLPATDPEVIRDVDYAGERWHWRGRVSRDQYQGVLLGMSLAYAASPDPAIRQIIREDVTSFAEQLMRLESKFVKVVINGSSHFTTTLDLRHAIYTDDETPDGTPIINISTNPTEVEGTGLLVFWPNPSEFVRQIPGLGWVPDVFLPSQAIQLAAAFRVAIQVTAGIPGYEDRHAALRAHYDAHVERWIEIARGWENTNQCGASYHGLNIAFMPLYTWVRLEDDPARRARLQREVLRDRLWSAVADHKNVFFAFMYAHQAPPEEDVAPIIDAHLAQLLLLPAAPQLAQALDVTWKYPEDPNCPGLSAVATDVDDRPGATFIWERQPWNLTAVGTPRLVYPGLDDLLVYWLGRHVGIIPEPPLAETLVGRNALGQIFISTDLATWSMLPGQLRHLIKGDFDGDQLADLAGLNDLGEIYFSLDLTRWTQIPGHLTRVVAGDFDADGRDDLAGLDSSGAIHLTLDRTSWTRIPGTLRQLVTGDLDGDGRADLAGINAAGQIYSTTDRSTWINLPGELQELLVADLDGDGRSDLVGINTAGDIYASTDLASWTAIPGNLTGLVVGDFNGDGKEDLAGIDASGRIHYTLDRGTWINIPGVLAQLVVGDLNADGLADLVGITATGELYFSVDLKQWTQIPGTLEQVISGRFD